MPVKSILQRGCGTVVQRRSRPAVAVHQRCRHFAVCCHAAVRRLHAALHARLWILGSTHDRRPVHALRRLRGAVEGLRGAATAAPIARRFDGADRLRAVFVRALVTYTANKVTAERVR